MGLTSPSASHLEQPVREWRPDSLTTTRAGQALTVMNKLTFLDQSEPSTRSTAEYSLKYRRIRLLLFAASVGLTAVSDFLDALRGLHHHLVSCPSR